MKLFEALRVSRVFLNLVRSNRTVGAESVKGAMSKQEASSINLRAKSSTNKEQSVPFKTALTMLLILRLNRAGDRMLPCRIPISRSCSSASTAS